MKKILMIISVATVALLLMVLYSNKSNEINICARSVYYGSSIFC